MVKSLLKPLYVHRIAEGYSMTIDDELLLEIFKPDRYGNLDKDAVIIRLVGSGDIKFTLEETFSYRSTRTGELVRMTPDIVVTKLNPTQEVAIELENDYDWDFQKSLRELKKYRLKFGDVRIIIPREYERFASLFCHENFQVYLWSAKRKWRCSICGYINAKENRFINFKCEGRIDKGKLCDNGRQDMFELVGLEDTKIEQYRPEEKGLKAEVAKA